MLKGAFHFMHRQILRFCSSQKHCRRVNDLLLFIDQDSWPPVGNNGQSQVVGSIQPSNPRLGQHSASGNCLLKPIIISITH